MEQEADSQKRQKLSDQGISLHQTATNAIELLAKSCDSPEQKKLVQEIQNTLNNYEDLLKLKTHELNASENSIAILKDEYRSMTELYHAKKSFLKSLLWPRLGNLWHYPPRLLGAPKSYYKIYPLQQNLKISIVTPSFNQKEYIEKTMRSVLDQNYPNLEFIIQDGGSTDGSAEIIEKYQNQLSYWESKKDNGQSNAINLGFQHATGDIMAYLNSDDTLMPGTLNYVAWYFENHPDVDVVYGHRILIDEDGLETGRWVLPSHDSDVLKWVDFIPQETLFWRRRIWDKAGATIDESFRFAMDWDLLARFSLAGAKMVRLPRFLGCFRVHSAQKTSSVMRKVGFEEMSRIRMRMLGYQPDSNDIQSNVRAYLIKHLIYHWLYRFGILKY